jgi:hypothetical protein
MMEITGEGERGRGMNVEYIKKVKELKKAILDYLRSNDRHYSDLSRQEQHIEDLAQALNTSLDQLKYTLENGRDAEDAQETPRERLANRMLDTAIKLSKGGRVDQEMADGFDKTLEAFDLAADLHRQAESFKDSAESAAIKHKRKRS